ncbi:MAG: nitronate monooxygenase [Candidatus Aminicenantes bacterium]|nr:nitronate monooxygenase [Candidatus Aminicenantes bacterium]
MERRLSKHWNKGREFLGVRYPLLCGAMTWISDSRLVRTVGEAGAFGVLAAGNMPVENLEAEVKAVQAADPAIPFAVNLITIAPNYLAHLKKLADMGVPYIVFAGSFPKKGDVQMAKASGAKVMCFASTGSIAARMIDYGTDALILEGSEAGGHIGHVSTVVLIQEVLFRFDQVPVFVAGGVATGRMIAHLLLMGAAGVQMGTVFAMSEECRAHPAFKERFRRARSREAMATPEYDSSLPIVSVRAIKNKGTEDFGKLQLDLLRKIKDGEIGRVEAQYQVEKYWIGALRRAVEDGDVDHGSLMAGQCVGLIDEVKPVRVIIEELVREAEETLAILGQG